MSVLTHVLQENALSTLTESWSAQDVMMEKCSTKETALPPAQPDFTTTLSQLKLETASHVESTATSVATRMTTLTSQEHANPAQDSQLC